jgi:hypothetical protein
MKTEKKSIAVLLWFRFVDRLFKLIYGSKNRIAMEKIAERRVQKTVFLPTHQSHQNRKVAAQDDLPSRPVNFSRF